MPGAGGVIGMGSTVGGRGGAGGGGPPAPKGGGPPGGGIGTGTPRPPPPPPPPRPPAWEITILVVCGRTLPPRAYLPSVLGTRSGRLGPELPDTVIGSARPAFFF